MVCDVDRLSQRARIAVRGRDDDEIAARLDGQSPPCQRVRELLAVGTVLCEGIDEPPARVPHLDQAELVDVAGDGRLHDLVAFAPQCICELRLRRQRLLADESLDRGVALVAVHAFSTSVRISRARSMSVASTTSGGARRNTLAPEVRHTRPASSAASTKGCAGASSSAPASKPAPRTSRTCGSPASPARRRSPFERTCESRSSSIASQTAAEAAHTTGLPPNVDPWSPGAKAPAASSATSRQPTGRPFASPFASV